MSREQAMTIMVKHIGPKPPDGDGWRLVSAVTLETDVYFFWERGEDPPWIKPPVVHARMLGKSFRIEADCETLDLIRRALKFAAADICKESGAKEEETLSRLADQLQVLLDNDIIHRARTGPIAESEVEAFHAALARQAGRR